jgi:hypothetical protein
MRVFGVVVRSIAVVKVGESKMGLGLRYIGLLGRRLVNGVERLVLRMFSFGAFWFADCFHRMMF